MRAFIVSLTLLLLAACAVPTPTPPRETPKSQVEKISSAAPSSAEIRQAARNFAEVVVNVEPVAEQFCRAMAPQVDCDFRIVVDDDPRAPPNAYQTVDRTGRPIIAFTVPLILEARNQDELAFIMAHEAAHHIEGHLGRQQQNAVLGAQILGALVGGTNPTTQRTAQQLGATIGARTYSKDFELEADALGTRIAAAAGYDPVRGADFFNRIPDPGNRFLGTHPPNAERIATVQRVAAGL